MKVDDHNGTGIKGQGAGMNYYFIILYQIKATEVSGCLYGLHRSMDNAFFLNPGP